MKHTCVLLLILVVLCFSTSLLCQSTNATISGMVLDQSGKVIPDAGLTILNEATSVQYQSRTNNVGLYTISILPPGQYRIEVSKGGFKTIIKPGIVLNVQSAVALNFTLPIGAASESITVDAGTPMLNTSDASVSTVIDQKFVQNIPLNGRSFQDLISMTPGVVTQTPQAGSSVGYNGDFSVNGQRTESNYYMIDGVSANAGSGNGIGFAQSATSGSLPSSTALGTTQSLLSVDELQEFRVSSSTYSAEFGRTPGGQFSFATKSGTEKFHGGAFDYLRNDLFDANDWFNDHYNKQKAALRQNDFGGTFGGPLWLGSLYSRKDQTFFFVSYEGLRLRQPQAASILYVPDACMRAHAPTALQSVLNAFPIQNGLDYGTCTASALSPNLAQFIAAYSLPASIDSTSLRLDRVFSHSISGFVRVAYSPSATQARTLSVLSTTAATAQTYTAGLTAQTTANSSNEVRLGLINGRSAETSHLDSFGGAVPTDFASEMGLSAFVNPYPSVTLNFAGIGSSTLGALSSSTRIRQWNFTDAFSIAVGHHNLKAGLDYRHILSTLNPYGASVSALYYSPQTALNNTATSAVTQKYLPSSPQFNELALYMQDEWHISQTVSLSLGLRYEVNPPPSEAHGNDAFTVTGNLNNPSTLALAPRGTPLWSTSWYNFAPRAGVAWTAHNVPGRETVVRAGSGVFFDTDDQAAVDGFTAIGFRAFKVYPGAALPLSPSQLGFSVAPTLPYTTVYAFPSHLQLPYTIQWNASLDQGLGRRQLLTLSYVASNGRRLIQTQEKSLSTLNPSFSTIGYVAGGVTSNYQSLQTRFQRTIAEGLQALISYTWSHSIDFGSNASALPLIRGNSDFDVRHNFQAGISWNIPGHVQKPILDPIISGWAIDARGMARTGFPVTLQGTYLTDPNGNQYYGNVNFDRSRPVYLYGEEYPGGRALNGGANNKINPAFTTPTGTDIGNAPRNFVRGFGASQINLGLRREFPLHESIRLAFRAEAFNITNHPNFGYIDPYLTDSTFGQATSMLNRSLGTVASQYQQGGPRSMQLALKIIF